MEKKDRETLLLFYQEQFQHLRFLTWLSLVIFFLFVVIFSLYFIFSFFTAGEGRDTGEMLIFFFLGLAMSAGAAHITIRLS